MSRVGVCCPEPLWALFQQCQRDGISFILHHEPPGWRIEYLCPAKDTFLPELPASTRGVRANWTARATVAVVGPDGSGKTTLIDAAQASAIGRRYRFKRFKRYFRRLLFHVRRGTDRNDLEERLLWLILPLAWCTFTLSRVWPGVRPMVLDRYFYDYFVRNVRDPQRPLQRIAAYRWCTALSPRPERLVVAACPGEIVHARKAEMLPGHVDALYRMYLDQIVQARVPRTLFCHTGLDPALSCRQMVDFLA